MKNVRVEKDCLGEMEIPNDRYYGIQTTRMMNVSGVADIPVIFYPDLHRVLFQIKKAAAKANAAVGAMPKEEADAIVTACDKLLSGVYEKEFPLDMWQGGGYTCVNMNVNEVIGNLANEILTGHKGSDRIHPNTHVNMGQSTNDTIPSATHLAIVARLDSILKELTLLEQSFNSKAKEFSKIVKVGRTCWQDALPLTLGQEFSGYASLIERLREKLNAVRPGCLEIVMGGSAVGTGLSAAPGYMEEIYKFLSEQYGEEVKPMKNLFDGFQNPDQIVSVSSVIKEIATSLSKICKDLRLMSSGPRAGWMEIQLPALSPGSSIMPGKINPTVPEMVIQVGHQVIGNDTAISVAYDEGELDLNVWDSTYYKCLFESLQLVQKEIPILRIHCIDGIKANVMRCKEEAESSIALCTVIATLLGYPEGIKVAHFCEEKYVTVREAVVNLGLLSEEEANFLIDPLLMTDPEKMARAISDFKVKKGWNF